LEIKRTRWRGHLRKIWQDNTGMQCFGLYNKDAADKDGWRVRIQWATS